PRSPDAAQRAALAAWCAADPGSIVPILRCGCRLCGAAPRSAAPRRDTMSCPKAVMNAPATFSFDVPGDAARAAELRRVKWLATLVLAATFAIFIAARALVPVHPAFGFIAAFAEAATIGGLADWYAVVALFKRPLGL